MTIHSAHPFERPPGERDVLRRWRGRLAASVSVWTTGQGTRRAGLTVSSMLVADGEPAEVVGLIDPDSDLADALGSTRTVLVSLLAADQRPVADVFAGLAPSPGGPFRTGEWTDRAWGPALRGAVGYAGVRVAPGEFGRAGWSLLVRGVLEHLELADPDAEPLAYLRGRPRALPSAT